MKKELKNKVVFLLATIHSSGLGEFVKGNIAFDTLNRILTTGTSVPGKIKEPAEDTELCSEVMVNPMTWGISDPRWLDFCEQWATA